MWCRVTIYILGTILPLICNFKRVNIKAATAHHCTIPKGMDKLLLKGLNGLLTGSVAFTQICL